MATSKKAYFFILVLLGAGQPRQMSFKHQGLKLSLHYELVCRNPSFLPLIPYPLCGVSTLQLFWRLYSYTGRKTFLVPYPTSPPGGLVMMPAQLSLQQLHNVDKHKNALFFKKKGKEKKKLSALYVCCFSQEVRLLVIQP